MISLFWTMIAIALLGISIFILVPNGFIFAISELFHRVYPQRQVLVRLNAGFVFAGAGFIASLIAIFS